MAMVSRSASSARAGAAVSYSLYLFHFVAPSLALHSRTFDAFDTTAPSVASARRPSAQSWLEPADPLRLPGGALAKLDREVGCPLIDQSLGRIVGLGHPVAPQRQGQFAGRVRPRTNGAATKAADATAVPATKRRRATFDEAIFSPVNEITKNS